MDWDGRGAVIDECRFMGEIWSGVGLGTLRDAGFCFHDDPIKASDDSQCTEIEYREIFSGEDNTPRCQTIVSSQ